jgi:hypothetical protein
MWTMLPRQKSRRLRFGLLCLLLCFLALPQAWPSDIDADLSSLSEDQLLTLLADNLTQLGNLQEKQQTELQTAQAELTKAQEQSSSALTLSNEAKRLSIEARDLASQSKLSSETAKELFKSFSDDASKQLRNLQSQNTWLKIGVGAALTIAAGALVWTAISLGGS